MATAAAANEVAELMAFDMTGIMEDVVAEAVIAGSKGIREIDVGTC